MFYSARLIAALQRRSWSSTPAPPLADALRSNTTALAGHTGDALWHPDVHSVLCRAGNSLLAACLHATAITHWQQAAGSAERILGPEHPDALTARANLAASYWLAGRTADVIAIEERVAADRERILGPEHPDTLAAGFAHFSQPHGQSEIQTDPLPIIPFLVAVTVRRRAG